ncbi:MAG: dynamin family protein [Nocardioides sp.]
MGSTAATSEDTRMVTALVRLHDALTRVRLPLDLASAADQGPSLTEITAQLGDYVIPRSMAVDAPLLTVVGGSTGAGKSTLVNSLVGRRVSASGVLRPTTRSPVLVHHPADSDWFGPDRLLPDLIRSSTSSDDPGALQLVSTDLIPQGLAVLDAPDVDSVEEANRVLAAQLLAAADMWLFVTSAARYADQVPWEFLRAAAERSTAVAVVLDRTAPESAQTVAAHLARMLIARGLKDSPLFVLTEGTVENDGLLAPESVKEIRVWLEMLAHDSEARRSVVTQTLTGAIRSVARRTFPIADAVADQVAVAEQLRADAVAAYDSATSEVMSATADGTLLRGEVLARWQEFVGTGELLKSLETRVGRLRDRVVGAVKGKPQQVERIQVAVESGLELLILEHAEQAAERAAVAWRQTEAGRRLLASSAPDLSRASRSLRPAAERAVRDWQAGVLEMVRSQGADKRSTARVLALGVNGLSVSLMMVVFATTAGVTGAEAGIAGGSAVLGQKLLEAVFGDQAVRTLVERARGQLQERLQVLLASERARYTDLVDGLGLTQSTAEALRQAARGVDDARFGL